MTKIEKVITRTLIVIGIVFIIFLILTIKSCNDSGGIKGLLVEAGKDLKDISKEIEEYEPK